MENAKSFIFDDASQYDTIKNPKNINKTNWLHNKLSDDKWLIKAHIVTDELSKYTVDWNYNANKYFQLNSRWGYWKEKAKELAYFSMENDEKRNLATSSFVGVCRSIRLFYEYLCFQRKCFSLSDVNQEDISLYVEFLSKRNLKESTLGNYLFVITNLWTIKDYLSESLTFKPFGSASVMTIIKANAAKGTHTPTLLPQEIFYVLNEALKLVKNSSNTLDLADSYLEEQQQHFLKYGNKKGASVLFLEKYKVRASHLINDVRVLYGAAITIVLILLAERKHELTLTRNKDVINILNSELDILYGTEKKTSGTTTGKTTERAVIQEVKDAFQVIMRLTSHTRKESGLSTILLKLPFQHSVSGGCKKSYYLHTKSLYSLLKDFASAINFSDKELRPHMFRRAYSMLWTWRFEIGDLNELSLLLKHNNHLFTKKYTDDEQIWHFMPDAERKIAFDILNSAFLKKNKISGGISKTLERYGRIIQAKSRMLDATAIAEFVDDLIETQNLTVISHADGYCFLSEENLKHAKCSDHNGKLSAAKRHEALCAKCPNFGIDYSRRNYWEKRIELHQIVVNESKNSKLISSSKEFINNAKKLLSKTT